MEEYAKYINERNLSYAIPTEADFEGTHYSGDLRSRPDILSTLGFYPIVDSGDDPGDVPDKHHLEERYSFDDEAMQIVRGYAIVEDEPLNRSISKRKLMNNLKSMGIWNAVKQFMQSNENLWDNWETSTTLDEQEEMMQSAIAALRSALSLTEDQIEQLIDGSVAE